MLDALRGLDWVPRSVRKLQRDVDGALTNLRHLLGREPDAPEIAEALGVSDVEYDAMLDQLRAADLAVVRRATNGGGDNEGQSLIEIAIEPGGGPYAQFERSELRAELARALARLPEREKHILALYYEQELTLAEVGQVIGVSESRVSQLRTQAIARLRSMLGEWLSARETH
jgi:RNA polymerase sigma factor for flagellar operon FliA